MKVFLFPGCMVLARFQGYELASRMVLQRLGYQVVDPESFLCCGSSLLPGKTDKWVNFSAYSLALAETENAPLVTLCGNCTQNFKRARLLLRDDPVLRKKTETALGRMGVSYGGDTKVFHILELLSGRLDDINKAKSRSIRARTALTHPCQVFRPKEVSETTDDPDRPQSMKRILAALEVDMVDYPMEYACCGATGLLFDEDLGLGQGKAKMESARSHGADLIAGGCGNCLYVLKRVSQLMQRREKGSALPVLGFTQLVAVAFGFSAETLKLSQREARALALPE